MWLPKYAGNRIGNEALHRGRSAGSYSEFVQTYLKDANPQSKTEALRVLDENQTETNAGKNQNQ